MFRDAEILRRLSVLDERLARLEAMVADLGTAEELRRELEQKRDELDSLSRHGLHVLELLDEARQEIARLRSGQAQ